MGAPRLVPHDKIQIFLKEPWVTLETGEEKARSLQCESFSHLSWEIIAPWLSRIWLQITSSLTPQE